MHRSPRSRRSHALASVVVTTLGFAFGAAGTAAADAPNCVGTTWGDAAAAPVTPAYDNNQRPAGAGTGRKIG